MSPSPRRRYAEVVAICTRAVAPAPSALVCAMLLTSVSFPASAPMPPVTLHSTIAATMLPGSCVTDSPLISTNITKSSACSDERISAARAATRPRSPSAPLVPSSAPVPALAASKFLTSATSPARTTNDGTLPESRRVYHSSTKFSSTRSGTSPIIMTYSPSASNPHSGFALSGAA